MLRLKLKLPHKKRSSAIAPELRYAWSGGHRSSRSRILLVFVIIGIVVLAWLILYFFMPGYNNRITSPTERKDPFTNLNGDIQTELADSEKSNHLFTMTDTDTHEGFTLMLESDDLRISSPVKGKKDYGRDVITIPDAYKDTDLSYQIISDGIKERIILKSTEAIAPDIDKAPDQPFTYPFLLTVNGLTLPKDLRGLIPQQFSGSDGTSTFSLGSPIMKDANGNRSDAVVMLRAPTQQPGVYRLIVIPDIEWLAHPKRVFPVSIESDFTKGRSPVAVWDMNEGYGTSVRDASGNGNDLGIVGASWVQSSGSMLPGTTYLQFDGDGDYLSRSGDSDFSFGSGSFTITGTFKHTANPPDSGIHTLLSHTGHRGGPGYKIYMNKSGCMCFGIDDDASSFPEKEVCSSNQLGSLADSSWHTFTAIKKGKSALVMDIDGNQITESKIGWLFGKLDADGPLYIGIDADGKSNAWNGYVSSISVYPYEKTP